MGLAGPIIGPTEHHRARGARKREREDKSIQGPYWPNQSAVSHQTVVCYFVPIQHHHQLLCRIKPVQICHSNYSLKWDEGESLRWDRSVGSEWRLTSFQYQVPRLVSKANRMEHNIVLSKYKVDRTWEQLLLQFS